MKFSKVNIFGHELENCTRCGGTGDYPRAGYTCFKCNGAKAKLSSIGKRSFDFLSELSKNELSKNLRSGDVIKSNRYGLTKVLKVTVYTDAVVLETSKGALKLGLDKSILTYKSDDIKRSNEL